MTQALYLSLALNSLLQISCGSDSRKMLSTLPQDDPKSISADELKIQDVADARKYLILQAIQQPKQTLYSAYFATQIVAQNLRVYWCHI